MRVALHDCDGHGYPNLALMKLSAWHKANGDEVSWFMPLAQYDRVYSSKVFTWTPEDPYLPTDTIKGGTGYGLSTTLPEEVEHICPDYNLYHCEQSYGFLTRGCPNACPWCVVPKKEGRIRAHADIEEFARHKRVVLMDNNVLACDHGVDQLAKIARLGLRIDFNQGLDARRIDDAIAKRLSAVKWIRCIRLACDQKSQMEHVRNATERLRANGYHGEIFCYVLIKDVNDALERIDFLRSIKVDPFAQPYRDFSNSVRPSIEQRQLARWCNNKALFKSCSFAEYKINRGARI